MTPARFQNRSALRALCLAAAFTAAVVPAFAGDEQEDPGFGGINVDSGQQRDQSNRAYEWGKGGENGVTGAGDQTDRPQREDDRQQQGEQGERPSYDRVDWANQDGPREARDNLAKVIGTTRIGYERETLANAGGRDLAALNTWFEQVQHVAPDFVKNTEHARKKLKGKLEEQTIYTLYKARTDGWGDKQDDKDDFTVVASFLRYAKSTRSPLIANIRDRIVGLIVAAGPAYKVTISPEEAADPDKLAQKFTRDLDKGALQFPAAYLQGLILDKGAFDAALTLSKVPDEAIADMNRPPTRSDIDMGPGAASGTAPGDSAEARAVAAAQSTVSGLERELADLKNQLGIRGQITRETLIDAAAKNPELGAKLADTAARLAEARNKLDIATRRLEKSERERREIAQQAEDLGRRYDQMAAALGKPPENVKLTGPFADHRARIEKFLAKLPFANGRASAADFRMSPQKLAEFVNFVDRTDRAIQFQLAAEDSLSKLATQRGEVVKTSETIQLSQNASAEARQELEKIKADLAAADKKWEEELYKTDTQADLRRRADELSKEMNALNERMNALAQQPQALAPGTEGRTRAQINAANRSAFQEMLASADLQEVVFETPVQGKLKDRVTSGANVNNRQGTERVGYFRPKSTFEITGALLQSANASSPAVKAYKVKMPEAARKVKTVEQGFVATSLVDVADADALSAAIASAKPASATASEEGPASSAPQMTDQQRKQLEAQTLFWTTLQMASADLERLRPTYTLEMTDRSWPSNNAVTFKPYVIKKLRDAIAKYEDANQQCSTTTGKATEQINVMEKTYELTNSNMELMACIWGKRELRKLETIMKESAITAPPSNYVWGRPMSIITAAE